MIQLDRHIEILLLSNDCVIVPGLGGFMAHHVCAKYHTDSQLFLPPLRQLGFNAQLKINDSLLVQSYIEAYDISYPEALRRIDDEVAELKQTLQNNGFCELNDIGILKLNNDGNIEFVPCEAGILTPGLFGLDSVDILPLALQKTTASTPAATASAIQQHVAPKPIPQLATAKSDKEQPNVVDEDEDNDEEPRISIRISTIKHVATVAAVIIALFVCAIPFGKLAQPELSKSYIDTGILYNILPEGVRTPSSDSAQLTFKDKDIDSEKVVQEEETTEPAETNTDSTANKTNKEETEKENIAVDRHFFSIVLASRVTKTNAQVFTKQLASDGYDKAEIITRANGAKVIYGRYRTEQEARTSLNSLRSASDAFADGWIMEFN